jgi:CheY-like chemotaxis protein
MNKMKHVLIVEDDELNTKLVQIILKTYANCTYDTAINGKEAYIYFKENKYDCILMDITLPIMNGIDATKLIRQYEKENDLSPTKIVAVTASTFIKEYLLTQGFNDFLLKPFKSEKLIEIINN